MSDDTKYPVQLTDFAASKIKFFINNETIKNSNLKLRVYVTGGGCNGLQYGFVLDEKVFNNDCIIEQNNVSVVIDPISLQYLSGGVIDYYEGLEGSRFFVINPNAEMTCSCGSSFSV